MLNVLFAADFPIAKSGIASTASSILSEDVLGTANLFSELPLSINGVSTRTLAELGSAPVDLIFSHTEYSGLSALQLRYPEAVIHVGDWPLRHWQSIRQVQLIKGILATLRCHWRLRRVSRKTRLAFVTQEDCAGAVSYGFSRALHIPIGVKPPKAPLASSVDTQTICFSGNFRYGPNRDAAQHLLTLAQAQFPKFKIALVGFYADDFKSQASSNVEIYADVPSVVDFLATRRPIYVSLIETGAGAKNKILEAMVAGCPIICTPQSLDSSIQTAPSIKVVTQFNEVASYLQQWSSASYLGTITLDSSKLAKNTRLHRSWHSVASTVRDLINPRSE